MIPVPQKVKNNFQSDYRRIVVSNFSHQTEQKIWSFLKLEKGWHFGDGKPIKRSDVKEVIRFHTYLLGRGFVHTDAFPGISGEIQVTAYSGEDHFEFTREPDGRWTFVSEIDGLESPIKSAKNISEIQEIAESLYPVCNSFDYYITDIGTLGKRDSAAWRSSHRATMGEFQSSRLNAYSPLQHLSAVISEPSTNTFRVTQPFSGSFLVQLFHSLSPSLESQATEEIFATEMQSD